MSPVYKDMGTSHWRFPRVSGDEPRLIRAALLRHMFSPRERG